MPSIARLLWTSAILTSACGRLGFEELADGPVAAVPPTLAVDVECGAPLPPPSAVRVTNTGGDELRITSAQATGGFTVVTTLPLVIAPGDVASLEIRPPAAVIGTDRDGSQRTGSLDLVTNEDGLASHQVALVATILGANVELTDLMSQPLSALAFSAGSGACPTSKTAQVTNTGSRAIQVAIEPTSSFAIAAGVSGVMVGPGSSAVFSVRPLTSGPCSGADVLAVAVTGPVCAVTPSVLQATFDITGASTCACS